MTDIHSLKYSTIIKNFDIIVFARDLSKSFLMLDGAVEELLGVKAENIISGDVKWLDLVYEEDKKHFLQNLFTDLKSNNENSQVDFRIQMPDGSLRWRRRIGTVENEDGSWVMRGIIIDIHDKKVSEETSSDLLTKFSLLSHHVEHGLIVLGQDLSITYVNNFTKSILSDAGLLWEDCIIDELISLSNENSIINVINESVLTGFIIKYSMLTDVTAYLNLGKKRLPIDLKITKSHDNTIYFFFSDISELIAYQNTILKKTKELQELNENLNLRVEAETAKNIKHEKMIATQKKIGEMGRLVSSIAHRWRQPINSLGLNIQYIKELSDCGELTKDELNTVHDFCMVLINEMSVTIDGFADLFKVEGVKKKINILNKIWEVFDLYKPTLEINHIFHKVSVEVDGQEVSDHKIVLQDTGTLSRFDIFSFENETFQIILNLLVNSVDAIIERRSAFSNHNGLISVVLSVDSECIRLKFSDNGTGIREDILENIFEPYFTTKDEGKGIGMGLYLTKVYVEKNLNGKIVCENIPNGCRCTISIPISSD